MAPGVGPFWIGLDAAYLVDRDLLIWPALCVVAFAGVIGLRAVGYRWQRGTGIHIGS